MINAMISALLQLGAVLLVALCVYALARRPGRSFAAFVGLTPAPWKPVTIGLAIGLGFALALIAIPGVRDVASAEGTVVGEAIRGGVGMEVLSILVVRALIQTSLTEELVFRGLIGRNLVRRFGFAIGNTVQATSFGAVHFLLLLVPDSSVAVVALIVAAAATAGWIIGWINERMAAGSILPGWAAHGAANLGGYLSVALMA